MEASTLRALGPGDLMKADARPLDPGDLERLWEILAAINANWRLFWNEDEDPKDHSLLRIRSSWREFVRLRSDPPGEKPQPSYAAEYDNAIAVVDALKTSDPDSVWDILFSVGTSGARAPSDGATVTAAQLLHAKKFVIDEFMTVLVTTGGFKAFGGRNTHGYMAGSRTSRTVRISAPFTFPERDA
jgi:hypothetical protein